MKSIIRDIAAKLTPLAKRLVDLQGDIAVHLAKTLSAKGMTQRELAQITGMSEPRISKILSGDDNLTLRTIARLELATGEILVESPMFRSHAPVVVHQSAPIRVDSLLPSETYSASQEMHDAQLTTTATVVLSAFAYAKLTTRRQNRI